MTIVTTAISSGPYVAAAQTTFAVTFQSESEDAIEVYLDDVLASLGSYVFNRDDDGTGDVVFTLPVTGTVEILSKPTFLQPDQFERHGAFYPDQINSKLDRAAIRDLWLKGRLDLVAPPTTAAARAGKYLAWDAFGDPIPSSGTGADAGLRTDLVGANGSLLILHKAAGAGTYGRTMRQWGEVGGFETANIMNWVDSSEDPDIVAGTSVNNHSAAGQAALDLDARRLILPKGRFNVSDLRVRSGSRIAGAGPGNSTLKALANQLPHVPPIRNYTDKPANAAARDTDISISGLTIDGNKANNATQIEYGHGIELFAINRAFIEQVVIRDTQGDGVVLMYAFDAEGVGGADHTIGCSDIHLQVMVENAERQGVALVCAEDVTGDIFTRTSRFFGLDIEPDNVDNFMRNITLRHLSYQDGDGSASAGGIGIGHAGAGSCENISLDFVIYEPDGRGVMWRQAKGLNLRGHIIRSTSDGLKGFSAGATGSTVHFDVHVEDPGVYGMACQESVASTYNGRVSVNSATDVSVGFSGAAVSGTLDLHLTNGGQQGFQLANLDATRLIINLTTLGMTGHCLWLTGTTNGLRVNSFRSDGSTFGKAIIEADTADNNRVCSANISGSYSGDAISLLGPNSMVEPSATTGIVAFAGGGKASATKLRSKFNIVATVATAADSVLLPAARLGDRVVVKNSGANAMQVFGQGTDTINAVATGTGISQAAATTVTYFAPAAGQWQT